MFAKPAIGSRITVTTDYGVKPGIYASYVNTGPFVKSGIVVPSEKFDDYDSFRLRTDNKMYPVSVIALERVSALVYDTGEVARMIARVQPVNKTWQVKSDSRKGGFYTVDLTNGHYSCTCQGFVYRKSCRHINGVKQKEAA